MKSLFTILYPTRELEKHPETLEIGDVVYEPSFNKNWKYLIVEERGDKVRFRTCDFNTGEFREDEEDDERYHWTVKTEWPTAVLLEEGRFDLVEQYK